MLNLSSQATQHLLQGCVEGTTTQNSITILMLAVTGLNRSVYRGTEKEANAGLPIVKRPKESKQDLQWLKRGPRFVSSNKWLILDLLMSIKNTNNYSCITQHVQLKVASMIEKKSKQFYIMAWISAKLFESGKHFVLNQTYNYFANECRD